MAAAVSRRTSSGIFGPTISVTTCRKVSVSLGAQFLVQLPLHSFAPDERHPTTYDAPEPPHHSSPSDAFRIRPMAAVWTSQTRVSRLSMARPEAVSA